MHIKPKKGLGQNFLVDQNIQKRIINALELSSSDTVLEIGAGKGELTQLIARKVKLIFALEIDAALLAVLKDKFKGQPNVRVVGEDFLKFNLNKFPRGKIKVFGNVPYYISTPILERIFAFHKKIASAYLSLQKEFARRITAKSGSKECGSLSIFAQYYSQPEILFQIKAGSFWPRPKVDSSFVRLKIRRKPPVTAAEPRDFFAIVRQAFGQRRKILKNSLKGAVSPLALGKFWNNRPEELSLEDFAKLANTKKTDTNG